MATTYLSPGVWVTETDNSSHAPQVGVSTGAGVITSGWGAVLDPQLCSSQTDMVNKFLAPNDNNFKGWFTLANFLDYTGACYVTRAKTEGQRNAVANPKDVNEFVCDNETDYTTNYELGNADVGQFCAKYPGKLGNSLMVTYADAKTFANWTWTDDLGNEYDFSKEFSYAPSTSDYVKQRDGSNDEMHVLVVDAGGRFSGRKGTILEKYPFVSKAKDGKSLDGTSNFYRTVLKNQSRYVYWLDFPSEDELDRTYYLDSASRVGKARVGGATTAEPQTTNGNFGDNSIDTIFPSLKAPYFGRLQGGADDYEATDGQIMEAFALYKNREEYDISLIPTAHYSATVSKYVVENVCQPRMDAMAFVSPNDGAGAPITGIDILDDTVAFRDGSDFNVNSSYCHLDSGWKYQYDQYNDAYRWIPLCGDSAGIYARTDATNATWWSGAGFSRGQYKNVIKLNFSPNQTERDILYPKGINPVVTFKGEGTVLYGDKTLLTKPSAFDRMNVRRLFIYLEKVISNASRSLLFEFNDEITQEYFRSLVRPILETVKGSRGIERYQIVCGAEINTPEVRDQNLFKAMIRVVPNKSINFIDLNFVCENSTATFSENGG